MTTSGSQEKVIIIGAGVGGLALAQILRKANIPAEVYERDPADKAFQGWGFGLDKCLDVLVPLLPDDLRPLTESSPNNRIGISDNFLVINGVTGESLGLLCNFPIGHPQHLIHADRSKLRRMWLPKITVHYSKSISYYEESSSGVTAHFTDGTSTQGTVLVGADGSSSKVRSQLLKGFEGLTTRYTVCLGEADVDKKLKEALLGGSHTGLLIAGDQDKGNCMIMKHYPSGGARFGWTYAWKVPEYQKEQAWARKASAEELYQRVVELTAHWPPAMKAVQETIKLTKAEGIHLPVIRFVETVLPSDTLPEGRVTLLGDAAHSMLPFRGMGANKALEGAAVLGKALINGLDEGISVSEILRSYEREWIPKGRQTVLESREAGEGGVSADITGGRFKDNKAFAQKQIELGA